MLGGYPATDYHPIQGMVVHVHTESCLAAIRTVSDFTVYDKLGGWERVEQESFIVNTFVLGPS